MKGNIIVANILMASLYKLVTIIGIYFLFFIKDPVDSTWNNAEGGNIPVPQDKLSWPQISLVTTVFFLLVILWFYGILPVMVAVPLNHLIERRSIQHLENPKERTYKMFCQLMASATSEPVLNNSFPMHYYSKYKISHKGRKNF